MSSLDFAKGRKREGLKEEASGPQIEGEVWVIPEGSWMTDGDFREKDEEELDEVRVVGSTTARTEVAASIRRRVSWKVATRRGQWDWKSVISITASSVPSSLFSRLTMPSTSIWISRSRDGDERI